MGEEIKEREPDIWAPWNSPALLGAASQLRSELDMDTWTKNVWAKNQRLIEEDIRQMEKMTEEMNPQQAAFWILDDFNAEDLVTLYGSLSTYLTILAQQPDKDLETIARVTRLMIAIKPQAVEASQEIAGREK